MPTEPGLRVLVCGGQDVVFGRPNAGRFVSAEPRSRLTQYARISCATADMIRQATAAGVPVVRVGARAVEGGG